MRTMGTPNELWRMRKEIALQLAETSFMTYFVCLGSRVPSRFHWSRATGQIAMSEILPGTTHFDLEVYQSDRLLLGSTSANPMFASTDSVPFRFTPNFQHLLGPILTEGVLASGIMAIARCLTEPEVRT